MKTLKLSCPKCGADETNAILLDLNALNVVKCEACDEEFTAKEAASIFRERAARWAAVVQWIDSAPAIVLE
jgi:transcription elongation factor Elf1